MLLPALIAAVVSGIALGLLAAPAVAVRSTERALAASRHRAARRRARHLARLDAPALSGSRVRNRGSFRSRRSSSFRFSTTVTAYPRRWRLFVQLAAAIAWLWLAAPMPDLFVAATDGRRDRLDGQFVQFHGWQRRPCRHDDRRRLWRLRAGRLLGRKRPCADLACAGGGDRSRFCWPTGRRRAFSSATSARCPWASWPPYSASRAGGRDGGRRGFRCSFSCLLSPMPARRCCAGCCAASAVWQAHRDHYYQRLVQLGLGHAGTLALYAALMIGAAVIGAGSARPALRRPDGICWSSGRRSWPCCSARSRINGEPESADFDDSKR